MKYVPIASMDSDAASLEPGGAVRSCLRTPIVVGRLSSRKSIGMAAFPVTKIDSQQDPSTKSRRLYGGGGGGGKDPDLIGMTIRRLEAEPLWSGVEANGCSEGKSKPRSLGHCGTLQGKPPKTSRREKPGFAHTLTPRVGHVKLHASLYALDHSVFLEWTRRPLPIGIYCKRDNTIILRRRTDWMEWQAGVCMRAFVEPVT